MAQGQEVAAEAAKKQKDQVEVRYNGVDREFRYKPSEKVKKLLEEALEAFGVAENAHRMSLFTAAGVELSDEQKLEEAGVKAGDRLQLRMSTVKGGSMLKVSEGLLTQTLTTLRACGDGREECVVFWSGPIERPDEVDTVLHPDHSAVRGGYEVSPAWMAETWDRLAEQKRAIRAQVHSHPLAAFHSRTDDEFPVICTPGFFSLVIPRFAVPPQTLEDAYLARLGSDGRFTEVAIEDCLLVEVSA